VSRRFSVGWATSSSLAADRSTFRGLETSVAMRIANVGRWLNRNLPIRSEMYRPERRYDVVVFVKAMDDRARGERERVQARGAKAIFDANVNYYEIWGDYELPNTQPTEEQRAAAVEMTERADAVVADSTYILDVVEPLNDRATWIPDNVDLRLFRRPRKHRPGTPVRLVWSGRSTKAQPLTLLPLSQAPRERVRARPHRVEDHARHGGRPAGVGEPAAVICRGARRRWGNRRRLAGGLDRGSGRPSRRWATGGPRRLRA